jgi:hypothetical protein
MIEPLPEFRVPIVYAGFDPGLTTGFAFADKHGHLIYLGSVIGLEDLSEFLMTFPETIERIVYEKWVTNNRVRLGGSNMPASQAQGIIKMWARMRGIPIDLRKDEQPNTIKKIGYAKLKTKPPTRKSLEHQWDAAAHLEYWLWTHRIGKYGQSKSPLGDGQQRESNRA